MRLAKDANSGVVTIWAEKARHCMIPKSEGQCIHWDDDTHGFVSCGHASDLKKHAKQDKEQRDASAAFGSVATLTHGNLCVEISRVSGVGKEAAKKRIKTWTEAGLIQKLEGGGYALVAPPSLAALSSPSSGCSLLLDAAS